MILSDINNDQNSEFGQEAPKTQLLSDITKETRVSFDEFKKMGHTAPEYESDAFDRLYGGIDNQLRQMMTVGNQLKVFGGQVQMSLGDMFGSDNLIERGRSNIQTASRNLDKQLADIDLAKFPVSQKDQKSFVYGLGSGVANYGVMLVGGYGSGALLKAVGAGAKAVSATTSAVGIGSMAALEVGGETQEGLDIYKQRTGDTELKNITPEWAKKEAATTALYGVASGIIEKKFGFGAQRKMFKSPLTFIKGASKTALSEGATEALQELTNAGIDLADGSITWEQLPERIRGAMMEGAIGAVIGGSAGVSVAYAQRANGVKYIKEQIKNTVPVKDQDVVAKSIYDDGVKTLSDVISRELELSSEMQAQHGLVWDNMNKAVKSAIDDSIAQGNEFFSRKSEDSIAEYVTSTSKLFADQVLAEANKRGMLIQDVLDGAKIEYANGKIYLKGKNFNTETARTTSLNQDMFFQEILDISKQNDELDAKYPAYEGETININGQEKTVYNSNGDRIAKSKEALENFYRWFGDSKVVDEQGQPLVVYHGSLWNFDTFKQYNNDYNFTPDEKFAYNYAERKGIEQGIDNDIVVYPVYLKAQKPFDFENKDSLAELENFIKSKKIRVFGNEKSFDDFMENVKGIYYNTKLSKGEFERLLNDRYLKWFSPDNGDVNYEQSSVNTDLIVDINPEQEYFITAKMSWGYADKLAEQENKIKEKLKDVDFDKYKKNQIQIDIETDYGTRVVNVDLEKVEKPSEKNKRVGAENWITLEAADFDGVDFIDVIKSMGYDGYYKTENGVKNISVFNPNQIKSTQNRGTYSDSENKIYYQDDDDENIIGEIDTSGFKNEKFDLPKGWGAKEKINDFAKELANDLQKAGNFGKSYVSQSDKSNATYIYLYKKNEDGSPSIKIRLANHSPIHHFSISTFYYDFNKTIKENVEELNKLVKGKEYGKVTTGKQQQQMIEKVYGLEDNDLWGNRFSFEGLEDVYFQSAFAGSRVDYDRPSLEAIGSGEGAQAHGWGLYYALNRDVAERYRESFVGKNKISFKGKTYDNTMPEFDALYKLAESQISIEQIKKDYKDNLKELKEFLKEVQEYNSTREIVEYSKQIKETEKASKFFNTLTEKDIEEIKYLGGQVHEVDIPENPYLLDEELTFRNQSEFVQSQLRKLVSEENLTDKFEIYQSEENPKYNILENSDGEEIYKTISKALGSDKAASQLLEKYGIKGITYDGRQDGRCFVIFNPDDVKVIQKFYQGSSRASRGEYNVSEQAIKITETADFSTLPHELAHFWLDNQFKYIQSGLASQEYIDGFNPIKRYLGISDNQTVIKRYQQEKFARAYEKYLRTKELPDPMLKSSFDKYNKWLRMVYRDANKIRYRNEDGKLVTPKLTEDAVRFFRSMTTGYLEPPVNVVPTRSEAIKQEDAKQKAEGEKYMVREIERPTPIVEPTSIKTDRFGKGTSRVYERETGQTLEYNKINLKDQEQRANELVKTDINKARRIALGFEKADDLTQTAVNIAYRNEMKAIGNINEYAKALEYGSIAQTMRGQEISAERIGIKSPDTAEFWYDKAQYAKTQKVADKVYKSVDKEVFDNKVEALNALMKKKAKELADKLKTAEDKQKVIEDFQKSLQEEFDILYQEDFDDLDDKNIDTWAQRFVEKNFNVLPTEQEIEVINSKIDNLRELAESLEDANGNPSLEALRAYDQMNKYIESLNPSNDLAVFTSVVARGSMLASVKSPILNIVSNAETLLSEGITNRITTLLSGGSLENVVDSKLKSDYLKYGANAYRVSGFNISTAQDLNFERLVTGEKIITTQGEGAFKKFAQKIETGVFKYAMGFPDSISKDIAFVDRVSLECSNVARKEGLKGEALKNRANELFKDAIRIEPMTEEGEVIRKHGISYAHKATFTDDNALSQGALAIRDALNKLSGDLRAGDNLMPFVKTPASVINIGLEYTAGVVYMMPKLDVILRDVKRGEISDVSRQAINSGVRNGLGLLLAYMIADALDDDDYIPAYEDLGYGDTLLLKEKNVVYNSIKIGDKYVSLDYLGPIGVPVAGILGAKRSNGFGAFFGNVLSQFLRLPGVKDFADTVSGLSKMTKQTSEKNLDMLQQEAIDFISARTVPALVSDIAKAMDSYERDMSNDVWDRLKGKIPVLREELPKIYSKTTGEAVKSNGLLTLFVGSRVKEAQSNKIIREIEGIKSQGESVSLSDPTKYGDLRLLDKDDKVDIRKRFAEEYAERVLRTIELPSFENSSVERKAKLLNNARRHTVSKIKIDYRNKLLEKKRSR